MSKTKELFELSGQQAKSVKRGLQQISEGKTMPHQKASKEIKKWLSNN